MKNPYPETRGHTLQRACWQEGYDAKEKEAQDLYEACDEATMWVAKMSADGSTIAGRVLIRMRKALARWEDK